MSNLESTLKERTKVAMKAKDDVARNIYRVVLGELQTAQARAGGELPDADGHKIIKKLIASNEATLAASTSPETQAQLKRENELLSELVPQALSVDAIVEALEPVKAAIQGAKADGPAMGIAMKQLKASGASVESTDVKEAITRIRA